MVADVARARATFTPTRAGTGRAYSVVIPPPNVTGMLHLGHVLRQHHPGHRRALPRMRGDNVLWMPGTDHAGIATENVVEDAGERGHDRHASSGASASSNGCGSGKRRRGAASSSSSSNASVRRAIGSASAPPWTRDCRRRCEVLFDSSRRAYLTRPPLHSLVRALPHRAVGRRGRRHRGRREGQPLAHPLQGRRRRPGGGGRDHPTRDDAGRYRDRGPPGRRALPRPVRQERHPAAARPADTDRHR